MNYEGKTKLGLILALGLSKCNHRNENYYNIHTIYLLPTKVKIKKNISNDRPNMYQSSDKIYIYLWGI